jgi:hypothetical protein
MNNHNAAGFDNQNQGADAGALLANGQPQDDNKMPQQQ